MSSIMLEYFCSDTLLKLQSEWDFSLGYDYEYDTYKVVHHIGSLFSN
jgi:hypothetical protein